MRPPLPSSLLAVGAALALAAPAAAQDGVVVADHLNNPRQLETQGNAVYVAEAGRGGRCIGEGEDAFCYGRTSSVTRVAPGGQSRVAFNFLSTSGPGGLFAGGVSAIAADPRGGFVGIENGVFGPASLISPAGLRRQGGALLKFALRGAPTVVAQVDDYEVEHNPAGDQVDANPYGVEATRDGYYVTDAGGNSLLRVSRGGQVSTVATFDDIEGRDAVPTSVRQGPDGALYVGTLVGEASGEEGEGEEAGEDLARVYRVVPGEAPTVYADGLNSITGLDFDADGNLYVSEFTTEPNDPEAPPLGAVVRVAKDTGEHAMIGFGQLFFAGGVAIGPDDSIYVSNNSVFTQDGGFFGPDATGEVVKFPPFEEGTG